MRHIGISFSTLIFSSLISISASAAASYPERPIHLIVGFPAGGASDVTARVVAEKMAEKLKVPVIVENRPGAGSNIGSSVAAKSAPDGYTVMFGTIALSINGSLYHDLNYDASTDFRAVSQLASAPFVLVTNPASDYETVAEFLDAAREAGKTDSINYASAGNGSGSHLFTELLINKSDIQLTHIPYRGAAPAMVDVLSGVVPVTFDNIITTLPLIKEGKLRPLAVSSDTRSPSAPDVPTLSESGIADYDASSWFGLFVPSETSDSVVNTLHEAVEYALHSDKVQQTLERVGAEPVGSTPEEFDRFFKAEIQKWADVISNADIQIQ